MKVSVIIPVYNQKPEYLKETIESVVNQTIKPYEIIFVDDGSDKPLDPAEIIENKLRLGKIIIRWHRSEKNRGIGFARGKGAELATGDYVCFCSSDDLFEPEFIEIMLKAAKEYPNKILYSNYYVIDKDSKLIEKRDIKHIEDHDDFCVACWEKASRDTMFVCFGTVFIPKKVFKKVQFDPEIRHSEDLDFLLRSMKLYKYHLVKEYLMRYRISPTMTTQKEYANIPIINEKVLKKCKAFWEAK